MKVNFEYFSKMNRKNAHNRLLQTVKPSLVRKLIKGSAVAVIAFAVVAQSFVFVDSYSARAKGIKATAPQVQGISLEGTPVTAVASAVINFAQLAQQDAARRVTGPLVPQVIHSPITPPEEEFTPSEPSASASTSGNQQAPLIGSPPPSASFIGMTDIPKTGTGTIVIPPDTTGAVGPSQIFTTVNNNYVVQNKLTGVLSAPVSMDTFWSGLGATGPFDPRTIYDPYNDRWIVSAVSDSNSANSSILLGVSQTPNPGGTYFTFRVDYDSTNTNWADFPVMGFNKNWVAIGANSVAQPGPAIPNKTLVVNYVTLLTGVFGGTLFSGTGTCAYPASTYSVSENTLYVVTHLSSAGGTYRLDTITGTAAAPAYALGATKTRTGGGWTQPTPGGQLLPQAAPLAGASACGATPCLIETQDSFIRSEPVFRNSNIYYAQTIALPAGGIGASTHTVSQWTKIDTSGNFVDGGRIEDPTATATNGGKWYNFASLAVNKFDEIILGFTQFASNQFPASGYTFHSRLAPAGTMSDPLIFKAGEDYYHKTFAGARNRWGDYSKAQVDPSDDAALWTMQEYSMLRTGTDDGNTGSNSSKWSTWWAQITLAPTAASASISGSVTTTDGSPVPGVTMSLGGAQSTKAITDTNGSYHFNNVNTANFYTVTPALVNHHFSPTERSFSLLANVTDAVFTATRDAAIGGNAIDSPGYFVRQHYLDFLGREPDESGFNFWTDQLMSCGSDAACTERRSINVSAAYFLSIEFQQTGGLVDRLYRASYARRPLYAEFMPDAAIVGRDVVVGRANWAQTLEANKEAFVAAWVQRSDFRAAYDGLGNSAFVDALIAQAGAGFNGDRAALVSGLNSGSLTRAAVLRQVVENEGFVNAKRNEAFVMMQYFGYLRRDPDESGYAYWLNKLNEFNGNFEQAEMVKAFIVSTEYRNRFR